MIKNAEEKQGYDPVLSLKVFHTSKILSGSSLSRFMKKKSCLSEDF